MSRRGVTLIELLTASSLAVLVVILVGQTSSLAGKSFERVQTAGMTSTKGRYMYEGIINDVKNGSATLGRYPVYSTQTFTAEDNKVLIIKQPVFDAANKVEPTKHRIVIYKVETPVTAADGPYIIKKYTASMNGTTETAAALEGVVAKNIASVEWTTQVNQIFWGDNSRKEFSLFGTPKSATPEIKTLILVGGVDRLTDGNATLTADKVTFVKSPAYGVIVDASYRGDETKNIDGTGNNGGTSVFIRMKVRTQWKGAGEDDAHRDITMSSRPTLLNKPE